VLGAYASRADDHRDPACRLLDDDARAALALLIAEGGELAGIDGVDDAVSSTFYATSSNWPRSSNGVEGIVKTPRNGPVMRSPPLKY